LGTITAVNEKSHPLVESFSVNQNYPNPFNPSTRISYNLAQAGNVRITVFDVLGRNIQTLRDGVENSGNHEVVWNARSANGNVLPSGIYFCRVQSGNQSKVIKMLLNK
jgi:flagellar hook assembly protein FlgD